MHSSLSEMFSSLQESINDVSLIDSDVRDDAGLLMTEEDQRREEKDEDHDDDLHERFTGKKGYPSCSFFSLFYTFLSFLTFYVVP